MLKYTIRRLLAAIPVLFGLSIILFAFVHFLPGDPCRSILGQHATVESCNRLRENLGLDQPLIVQYLDYLSRLLRLDFGASIVNNKPFLTEFAIRFPATIELTVAAMIFAVGVGIPLGRLAARNAHTWIDGGVTVISLLGISIPVFVLALTLVYIFAVQLGWLPSQGRLEPPRQPPGRDRLRPHRRPAGRRVGPVHRRHRAPDPAGDRPGLHPDGDHRPDHPRVRARREPRGLRPHGTRQGPQGEARRLAPHHAQRLAAGRDGDRPPVGGLLAGAVLTETVFAWPGVGRYVVDAIGNRDYFIIQSSIMIFAVIFLVVNLIVDLSYAYLNPRIRYS